MLEICTFSLESAFLAAESGADRLEVCIDYESGGLTPPFEWVYSLKRTIATPIFVMLRENANSFIYSQEEWASLKQIGKKLKEAGADGFVFGGLDISGRLAQKESKDLIESLQKPCVFHRAFDQVSDPYQAVDDAVSVGFKRILTGLGQSDMSLLRSIRTYANGRIEILPGGGIRSTNAQAYLESGFADIHSSAIVNNRLDASEIRALKTLVKEIKNPL